MAIEGAGRLRRWIGIWKLGAQRVYAQATRGIANRTTAAIGIVAIAIAVLLVITSISAGLAATTTVRSEGVDYWILPEAQSTASTIVTVEGTQLGNVHAQSERIGTLDGVDSTTPVLIELVQMRTQEGSTSEYVLGIGIIPDVRGLDVLGLSSSPLQTGDPYYNGGGYDGEFTGEVVLSPAAAELLDASQNDQLLVSSPASIRIAQSFAVTETSEGSLDTIRGEVPVALFHLSELQAYTGATEGDQADQVLVRTTRPGVQSDLQAIYPEASVVSRSGVTTRQVLDSDLPLAMSLTALFVGIVVAGLFVATSMALTVEADRKQLAVLATIGFSGWARLGMVATSTLIVTIVGGVVGLVLGLVGVLVVNISAAAVLGTPDIALFQPILIPYGIGVAVAMGLLALPYPVYLARRTDVLAELGR